MKGISLWQVLREADSPSVASPTFFTPLFYFRALTSGVTASWISPVVAVPVVVVFQMTSIDYSLAQAYRDQGTVFSGDRACSRPHS